MKHRVYPVAHHSVSQVRPSFPMVWVRFICVHLCSSVVEPFTRPSSPRSPFAYFAVQLNCFCQEWFAFDFSCQLPLCNPRILRKQSVLQPHRSLFSWQRIGRDRTQGPQRKVLSSLRSLRSFAARICGCGASRAGSIGVHLWFPFFSTALLRLRSAKSS